MDDTGHETILIGGPCRVGLEPGHLLGHHLDARLGAVEDAYADLHLFGRDGVDVVVAVGDEVEQVKVGEVLAVGEAGVTECHLQTGVAVAEGTISVEVGEVHHAEVLVAHESLVVDGVELVVVPLSDVVAELQCTLVAGDEAVVSSNHLGVLDAMSHHLFFAQDGVVLVGIGVLSAVLRELCLGHCLAVGEESLQRFPRLVVEEVLLARGVDDDVELGGVETGEDAVACQDEVLGAEGARAVLVVEQQGAELHEVVAAHECGVRDGEQHRQAGVARLVLHRVEADGLQVLMVAEGLSGESHCSVGGAVVAVVIETGIDDGIGGRFGHILYVGVIDDVLVRRSDDVPAAHEAHLVHVRDDVVAHTFLHLVAIVRFVAAPACIRDYTCGSCGCCCHRKTT